MRYEIDRQKIREGIEEMLKWRVNEILDNGGHFTLSSALLNYGNTKQLAIKFGVNAREYDSKVNGVLKEANIDERI